MISANKYILYLYSILVGTDGIQAGRKEKLKSLVLAARETLSAFQQFALAMFLRLVHLYAWSLCLRQRRTFKAVKLLKSSLTLSLEKGTPLSAKKWSSSDFDFSRWVSEAQDVTSLIWPWPEMMGGSLGPTELSFGDPSTWGWPGLGEVRCLERRRCQTQWGSVMRSWRRDCVMIGRDQNCCTQLCTVG